MPSSFHHSSGTSAAHGDVGASIL